MRLPRAVRAAIRRLHQMVNHKPKAVMIQIMKGANVNKEVINGVKFFRCETCAGLQSPSSVAPVKAPSPYMFNHNVIIDIFYIQDMAGMTFGCLSVVYDGTTFHVICMICQGHGNPLSSKCLAKFESHWVR